MDCEHEDFLLDGNKSLTSQIGSRYTATVTEVSVRVTGR